ncbi:hypothetical protein [Halomonas sp. BM-2019]|uniref:hypothetical protein n=1 Tax=Halomonas sp. BM-2019 TaxID=2811227 RepID=UPI001B3C44AE|nr:MAG: hypothetical protein J5F18_06460 [Halomonas sp. BM-2019]
MNTHRISNAIARAVLGRRKPRPEHRAVPLPHRLQHDGPMSVTQAANARRDAEYLARRDGLKAPLLQLWKVG